MASNWAGGGAQCLQGHRASAVVQPRTPAFGAGAGLRTPFRATAAEASSGLDSSGGVVVDERTGPLGGGTAQSLQGKSHESPALADGGVGVGRQKANEA